MTKVMPVYCFTARKPGASHIPSAKSRTGAVGEEGLL